MSFATANGVRVVTASIGIPLVGAWVADVMLEEPSTLTAPVTLVVGNLSLVGAVYRQGAFAGQQRARLVAGGGGWMKSTPEQAYANPSGVLLSTVLRDAAALVGEQVAIAQDRSLGAFFTRANDPAAYLLRELVDGAWYVDGAGVTQIGQRPTPTITSPFTVQAFDPGTGMYAIATEDLASWLPGASFAGPTASGTIAWTRLEVENSGTLRLHVLGTP